MDIDFRMALLFLAVALSGHAKTVKTTLQEQAIIYVMKTDVFFVCFFYFKIIKKKWKMVVTLEHTLLVLP